MNAFTIHPTDAHFLGRGWAYPLQTTPSGAIAMSEGEADIAQSIQIILGTMPGERVMRPQFGCRAWELVFEPNHAVTHALMQQYVREALAMWEPRIEVRRVQAFSMPESPERMLVEIYYEIKSSHDIRSIVYPFYLSIEEADQGEG